MLNYIWSAMIVLSFVVSIFTGRINEVAGAAMDGAAGAVETCVGLLGVMCLWTGIAKIAENSGLINVFSRLLRPITKFMFPNLSKNSAAHSAIVMNMVANILGMGNAATPLGLRAMKELDRINPHKNSASDEMCMFAVINTASIQIIPATVIALRQLHGSKAPSEIIFPVWICSITAATVGILAAKAFAAKNRKKRRRETK